MKLVVPNTSIAHGPAGLPLFEFVVHFRNRRQRHFPPHAQVGAYSKTRPKGLPRGGGGGGSPNQAFTGAVAKAAIGDHRIPSLGQMRAGPASLATAPPAKERDPTSQ